MKSMNDQQRPTTPCRWYRPCKYSKWVTTDEGKCTRDWTLKSQQRECLRCEKIEQRASISRNSE